MIGFMISMISHYTYFEIPEMNEIYVVSKKHEYNSDAVFFKTYRWTIWNITIYS